MQPGSSYNLERWRGYTVGRLRANRLVCNILLWFSVLAVLAAIKPAEAEASKEQAVRKQAPKGKGAPTAPVRRLTNKTILPVDIAPVDATEARHHVVYRVRPGDSFTKVLNRFNLSAAERQLWNRSIQQHFRTGVLKPGMEVHLYFAIPKSSGGKSSNDSLTALELDYDNDVDLTWEKSGRNILFQQRDKPFNVELATVMATVDDDDSLFASGHRAGIHSSLLSQLADIFAWEVDFEKDISQGDSFRILYEHRSRKGQSASANLRILAAELISAGQKLTAIYFEKQKGLGAYYDLEGRSMARAFLRFPLEFTSITSYFTDSRFHPIFKTSMPHNGVDFAAKRGTPVRAVGDGLVTQAGWNGGYGKLIEIQHDTSYTTRYAHLEKFAQGIKNGQTVKKGQVIGYVGSTGRATGPHLHFELYKDQQYVDPLSFEFPAEDIIEPALQRLFENQKRTFLVELTSLPHS